MQWQIVMVAAMLLIGGAVGFAELRRRAKPEQQRITEARLRFFAGEQPRVEVRAHEANLKSEPLVRLALQHGYELERTERGGAPGFMRELKYHFVLRGPDAQPASFMPESPDYAAYMRWEATRNRRIRRFYAVLIGVVGLLIVVTLVAR
ncbi:hypothetical protein [Streptomyces sp. NBC_00299]|uniref:hypothetical protein n=1 Tax=Streptomyces sp. NBC_00299 TaxID=2975705 RepID=UPI002E27B625|nr:hypothetical protein [Streptomyces sp. NBC_00299]